MRKNIQIVSLALIIILACSLLTACGKKTSIVGTWTLQTPPYDYNYFYPYKIYFYEDGTGAIEVKSNIYEMKWSIYDKTNLSIHVLSTFEFDGGIVEYYIAVLDGGTLNLVNKEQPTKMMASNGVYYSR